MDQKIINRLLIIASLGLIIAGGILLCISIFDEEGTTTPLNIALVCILLSSLFNIIRQKNNN